MHIGISSYPFSSNTVLVIGLYSVGRLVRNLVGGLRLDYYWVAFKSHLGCRRISARLVYLGSSMVPAAGLYSRERSCRTDNSV